MSMGWYDVSKVHHRSFEIVASNVDAVFAENPQEALIEASRRNGLKPWEMFGVARARGSIGINKSVARHTVRTNQIFDLKELIEQHV